MEEKQPVGKLIPMDIQPSSLLFAYDEIIKQPGMYILKMIRDKYPDKFREYIDIDLLQEISDKDLPYFYGARDIINPLQWLAKTEFDYEKNYRSLHNRTKEMYLEMPTTTLFTHMELYLKAFFITNVYFWTRDYDKRVDFDIQSMYNETEYKNKVNYVSGPFDKCITQLKIDIAFYPYLTDEIWGFIRNKPDTFFAFPNYGFNVIGKDTPKGLSEGDDNVGVYPIIEQRKPYFLG